MTTKSIFSKVFNMMSVAMIMTFMFTFNSCGGTGANNESKSPNVDDEAFYATQPLHSGLYDADYYDISGSNPRKGRFDGRIYFSLSPETSAFYVFENGNRTKIDNVVNLQTPFEKGDSGVYHAEDMKHRQVTISTDSTMYILDFQRGSENYKITFSPKPRHTGTALDILEKMAAQKNKK